MGSSRSKRGTSANMSFAWVYPMFLAKIEKKGRPEDELLAAIAWLTGLDTERLHDLVEQGATF